ncbi:MAG: hypothetical protein B7Z61_00185 [Acidobacteria bacterium 37-71-11]|nr:MAG: hypothetical protein B7Z61_00185 [Acidobacteria bacterium 37-71-11]HQT93613.1 hypothetical protein [Thermoanaerobaculaceae bacterium]
MRLFGQGRAALVGDPATAERLGWGTRRRSRPDPELILSPREGDPRREPWVAPPWYRPALRLETLRHGPARQPHWTYLTAAPGVARDLARLAAPPDPRGFSVGLAGLGRVGGVAATVLAAAPSRVSGIRELVIHDVDAANQQRWLLELGSIARWQGRGELPLVRAAGPREIFERCDAFLFAATDGVPPLGTRGEVRMVQLAPNRAILRGFLAEARRAAFAGLFLIVSDPVEWLAQSVFFDSNSDRQGRFVGDGLAPERIAGLGLGVMWARALAAARRRGWSETVARAGAAYGPHSKEVVAFDDVARPDRTRSERLSRAARECNFKVRDLGHLPYVGPGVSSVGLMLPPLLAGREALASVFVDGVYFGAPARLTWGLYPTGRRMADEVWTALAGLHARLRARARALDLLWE